MFLGGTLVGIYSIRNIYYSNTILVFRISEDPDDTFTSKDKNYTKVLTLQIVAQETATTGFWWRGTATSAKKLIDDTGNERSQKTFYLQMQMVLQQVV